MITFLSKNIETNSLFQMMIMVIFQQVVMVKKAMIFDFVVRNGSQIQYWITKCPTDFQILKMLSQSILILWLHSEKYYYGQFNVNSGVQSWTETYCITR